MSLPHRHTLGPPRRTFRNLWSVRDGAAHLEASGALFPARPSRASGVLGRDLTSYTSTVLNTIDSNTRDWPVPNPWIISEVLDPGDPQDERHWLKMEFNPAVKSAMNARISQLLCGGVRLEAGSGPGASELFDLWSWHIEEMPMTTLTALALRSIFRGHEIFENRGAFVDWREGPGSPRLYMPVITRDALTWQFRYTAGRDLIYCPGGLSVAGYRMKTLPAQMKWWAVKSGGLSNPYGEPAHGFFSVLDYAYRTLSDAGLVHIQQASGFLQVQHTLGLEGDLSSPDAALSAAAVVKLKSILEELKASGILWAPDSWKVDWVSLVPAMEKWIAVFRHFDDAADQYYRGASLSRGSESSSSRAADEVQERSASRRARVDAASFAEQIRAGLFRPWSAWNASAISRELTPTAATPRLEDVPMRSLPRLTFPELTRFRMEDLEVLKVILDQGVEPGEGDDMPRPDVNELLSQIRIPLMKEDQDGPTIDLAKKVPPPSPFGPQNLELGDRRGEEPDGDTVEDEVPVRER